MNSKKDTVKRLIIYLLIAFIPLWIITLILNNIYGGPVYVCEEAAHAVYATGVFGMLMVDDV